MTTLPLSPHARARRLAMWLLASGLALALAGCRAEVPDAPASAAAAAAQASGTSPSAPQADCPIDDFAAFAARFGREISFQDLTSADPLTFERFDAQTEPEPALVVDTVALDDVVWPLMPNLELLEGQGRTYDIQLDGNGQARVIVRTPDTSDQQIYHFAQAPCWQLQRVVDESI